MKKLISMSLYGTDAIYWRGAEENARLVSKIYPGWTMRVYLCIQDIDPTPLERLGCEIVPMPRSRHHAGMFWRFLAAWDEGVDRVLFRDADSRLNVREAATVQVWEESGQDAHCIMDHPHHTSMPISGGLWGIKTGILSLELYKEALLMGRRFQRRVADMRWLRSKVHPVIRNSLLRHSSVLTGWPHVPFPKCPEYEGFVGQQVGEDDQPYL